MTKQSNFRILLVLAVAAIALVAVAGWAADTAVQQRRVTTTTTTTRQVTTNDNDQNDRDVRNAVNDRYHALVASIRGLDPSYGVHGVKNASGTAWTAGSGWQPVRRTSSSTITVAPGREIITPSSYRYQQSWPAPGVAQEPVVVERGTFTETSYPGGLRVIERQ